MNKFIVILTGTILVTGLGFSQDKKPEEVKVPREVQMILDKTEKDAIGL